ncbi:MAG: hypothetical protein ACSHX4_04515 [Opitutaceae bacterium]
MSLNYTSILLLALTAVASLHAEEAEVEEPAIPTSALMPITPQVRQILDARCVMCHGAEMKGELIVKEDIDFSTDEAILKTLPNVNIMLEVIGDDDMPQGAKLPRPFRKDAQLTAELDMLKAEYEKKGEKAVLMDWLTKAQQRAE